MRAMLIVFVVAILAGCESTPRDRHTVAPTGAAGQVEGRPTLGQAIPIPGQPTVLVPFAVETWKGIFSDRDPYAQGGVAQSKVSYASYDALSVSPMSPGWGGRGGAVRWHNALFRDLETGEEWMLLDQRGIIAQWQVLGRPPAEPREKLVSRGLLFVAVLEDTNKDGLLNDLDARVAIMADATGRRAHAVTPREGQVWGAYYDPEKDVVFFQVATDTNRNGRFDFEDSAAPLFLPLGDPGPARPLVSEALRNRVESILGPRPGANLAK